MLKDSKVLATVERWSQAKFDSESSPLDSDNNSPQIDDDKKKESTEIEMKMETSEVNESKDDLQKTMEISLAQEIKEIIPTTKEEEDDYNEKVIGLAKKLLEEWSVLKEVFRIPKKERIEQMKEHEREADRRYRAGFGMEQDNFNDRKFASRYRINQKCKIEKVDLDRLRKGSKSSDKVMNIKLSKYERRKLFAMKVEQEAEERRRQQEFWRQHERNCMTIGADPRLTAPFDPNRGYQYVWNPQRGQWQNYQLSPNTSNVNHRPYYGSNNISLTNPQNGMNLMNATNNMTSNNLPASNIGGNMKNMPQLPSLPYQENIEKIDALQVKFMGPIPPPVKLPPKWKCAKDKYGRPYYYHIKIRKSQWEPPDISQADDVQDDRNFTSTHFKYSFNNLKIFL